MGFDHRDRRDDGTPRPSPAPAHASGKRTLADRLPVQLLPGEATGAADDPAATHDTAVRGLQGSPQPLPHLDIIQRCFGGHDVRGVRAFVGGPATHAATEPEVAGQGEYNPRTRTDAELRGDADRTPRQGETPEQAQARAEGAEAEFTRRAGMRTCFVAGTLVHTPDGPIPIERLIEGATVYGRPDSAISGPAPYAIAGRLFGQTRTLYHVTVEGGYRVAATRNHPFYVAGVGWRHAHALAPGDPLWTLDGHTVAVTAVEHQHLDRWRLTFNVHVAEASTYFVGAEGGPALWVHNADPITPEDPRFQTNLLWGLGASGPRQRIATDPAPDFDGASAFETASPAEVGRYMGVRWGSGNTGNHGAITRQQLGDEFIAVPTPSDHALSTEAGLRHYSIRPVESPDPDVPLTPEQMVAVQAKLSSIQEPAVKAQPKDFGCV